MKKLSWLLLPLAIGLIYYTRNTYPQFSTVLLWVLVVVELALLLFVLYKFRQIVGVYKQERDNFYYLLDALEFAAKKSLGNIPLLSLLIVEGLLFFYVIFGWFIRYRLLKNKEAETFTYHKTNLYGVFMGVIVFVSFIEMPVAHFFLSRWNEVAAWVVTGLTIYGLVWLIGEYNMIKNQPIVLTSQKLLLRIGMRYRADLELSNIKEIYGSGEVSSDSVNVSILMNEVNVHIALKEPVELKGVFGIKKTTQKLVLYLDDPSGFIAKVQEAVTP